RFPRILIADDAPDARRLVRRILQSQGEYTFFEAADGREALDLVNKEHPDLLILDLMMPEMDGFAVLDKMRSNPDTAEIPVIVSTAKELTPDEKSHLKDQIQALMQKGGFMTDELMEEVKSILR
ncbi:MAG: response regulator, partial [Anaerolineales bacterium]|nr:response regulator [Anaerolineales bacterium]